VSAMILETERLCIRYFKPADSSDLYDYLSREDVVQFEPYTPYSYEQAVLEARRRAEDKNFFAVVLKSGQLIGNLYLAKGDFDTWELGFVFHSGFWGKGYAFESARALISLAFAQWGARRIIAYCNPLNERSWRLLERLSFRREGTMIQNISFHSDDLGNPIWQDTYEYGLLKEEWKN
jgi:[ribosomal protein S5]-alanine N-acetyltransferase